MTTVEGMNNNGDTIFADAEGESDENGTGDDLTIRPFDGRPGIGRPPFDKKPLQVIGKSSR